MQRNRTSPLALAAAFWLVQEPRAALAEAQEPVDAAAQAAGHESSPRAAVVAYLEACRAGDYALAAGQLDLASVPAARRAEDGPELARHLKVVLDQVAWIDVEALSADEDGRVDDGLAPDLERVAVIPAKKGAIDVLLRKGRDERGATRWRVSSSTVARIPALYD